MASDDAYNELACAIIAQTVEDYRKALKAIKRNPNSVTLERVAQGFENWFMGDWFMELSQGKIDGLTLICAMRDQIGV